MSSDRPWYKRYPSNFIQGTMDLTLEERGAYSLVLDLIYDRGGPIPNDPRWLAGVCRISVRKWNAILDRLLQEDEDGKAKLYQARGRLGNLKADFELEKASKTRRNLSENGVKGAEKRAEKEAELRKNNTLPIQGLDVGLDAGPQHRARDQSTEDRGKKESPPPSTSESPTRTGVGDNRMAMAKGVIAEFDDSRAAAFGEHLRRPWPAPADMNTALDWIDAGATPDLCRVVFDIANQRLKGGGYEPRKLLSGMAEDVRAALRERPAAVSSVGGLVKVHDAEEAPVMTYMRTLGNSKADDIEFDRMDALMKTDLEGANREARQKLAERATRRAGVGA